jgi:XRE family transcriptional regulator, regulator of sulfur utilization
MTVSRRNLALLLPGLAGAAASGPPPLLVSKAYEFNDLPVRTSANGTTKSRQVFDGITDRGQRIAMHISELPPGEAPHPPARQPHEEIIMIREGTLEVTLNGQSTRLGPGSVIFSSFNDLNGWKNVGTTPVEYYVVSLEGHSA